MKKPFIVAGVLLGLAVLVGVAALAWQAFTVTDPYLVKPLTSSPVPVGASVGHSIFIDSRMLSVISSNDVLVVADPGASFHHEIVWLVERSRKNKAHTLVEFKFELPRYAAVDQIRPLGSPIPAEIQQVADGGQW